MKRIVGSENFPRETPHPVVTMGNFDGVHRGHKKLVEHARTLAAKSGGAAVAYTFKPHPVRVLAPDACPPLIQTLDQKLESLKAAGIDVCVIEPFTTGFAQLEPEEFFNRIVVERLKTHALVIGYDFTFGVHRHGTAEHLERFCHDAGIDIAVIDAQFDGETLVSSTQIRKLVAEGNVAQAARLLGRPYQLIGHVVAGRGLGESLGAHTANLSVENELIPGDGVYLTTSRVLESENTYQSVTSIGTNPTFPGSSRTIETHLIDVELDLMGSRLAVDFIERIRDQIAFATPEALRKQIAADLSDARRKHGKRRI